MSVDCRPKHEEATPLLPGNRVRVLDSHPYGPGGGIITGERHGMFYVLLDAPRWDILCSSGDLTRAPESPRTRA